MADKEEPSGLETKTFITGASDQEVNIGYSPAPVPFRDGMADGLTPGTTNTPGPYVAPDAEKSTSDGGEADGGTSASKTTASKTTASKTSTKTTGS